MLNKSQSWVTLLIFFSKTLAPAVHIIRFGVIPKKHQPGKCWLITDLSFPEGAIVNDAINSELCSLSYVTVEEVTRQAIRWVETLY